jgi:type IV pilus assembly protein PilV
VLKEGLAMQQSIHKHKRQRGISLLEALVSVLIFSVGILAIVALQAVSIKTAQDAKNRADASYLANQIIQEMWVGRGNANANLPGFNHNNALADCAAGGAAASGNAIVSAWLARVNATLPGASGGLQRIAFNAATNEVTVAVCWPDKDPAQPARRHVVVTTITG